MDSSSHNQLDAGIKQIFIDCDHTLVNTQEISFEAAGTVINQVLSDQNLPIRYTYEELLTNHFGFTARQMLTHLQTKHNFTLTQSQFQTYTTLESNLITTLLNFHPLPSPNIHTLLTHLTNQNKYNISIVSSSPTLRIHTALTASNLLPFFPRSQIISTSSSLPTPASKPNPAIYIHAMSANNVHPTQCIAIEDSRSGARAAIRAGVTTVAYVGAYVCELQRRQVADVLIGEGCVIIDRGFVSPGFPLLLDAFFLKSLDLFVLQRRLYYDPSFLGASLSHFVL